MTMKHSSANHPVMKILCTALVSALLTGTVYPAVPVMAYGPLSAAVGAEAGLLGAESIEQAAQRIVSGEKSSAQYADVQGETSISIEEAVAQTAAADAFEKELSAFPESYRPALRKLHAAHPTWHFVAKKTGTSWDDAVYEEYKFGDMLPPQNVGWWGTRAVSLTWSSNISSWKSTDPGAYDWDTGRWITGWDGGSLVIASREIVEYFLDPRNFLTESEIYMFFNFRYRNDMTLADVEAATKGSVAKYLSGYTKDTDGSTVYYPQMILNAAEETGVNPLFIIATITLENGVNGNTTRQISGDVEGYEGYYNYYNIAAYADPDNGFDYAWQRALWFASGENRDRTTYRRPWNTRQAAITGGAQYFANNYLDAGQDTYYLKRFNVMSTAKEIYNHQFSTDIEGAQSEAKLFGRMITDKMKAMELTFDIPVFDDMPEQPCPKPVDDTDPREQDGKVLEKKLVFANRLYEAFLGRKPSEKEALTVAHNLQQQTAAEVAYNIAFSKEARNRKMTDEEYVLALFAGLWGKEEKEARDDERAKTYLEVLADGFSRQRLFTTFVGFEDYLRYCADCEVAPGTYESEGWDFVLALYRTVLKREPSFEEVEPWVRSLEGSSSATEVAHALLFSKEAKAKITDNEEFIRILYTALLGRDASDADVAYWMDYLEDGCTRDLAFFGVAASKEFRYRWNALGLAVSDWIRADVKDQNPDLTRFVARLYRICLGREFDLGGLTAWVQALVSGYSGAKIVTGFAHSREFVAMTEDDNEYVSRLYEAILGREPDERGLADWLGSLEKGYTRDQVLRGFLRSREFKALCAGYGITAYN